LTKTHDVKTVVLRKNIDEEEAMEIVNQKKTKPFKSLLSRPKQEQVHVHSLKLNHECILMVSGKYVADYYRKATHSISVNYNIRDVVLGGVDFFQSALNLDLQRFCFLLVNNFHSFFFINIFS